MNISIIVAVTRDNAIGRHGDMLYHISADLRRFKALTMGHPLVMGRKTFESLPGGALPGRRNIVVTRNASFSAPGAESFPTLEAALEACGDEEIMVIGGGEIYRQTMPLAGRLLLTRIDTDSPDADTHFPAISSEEWTPAAADPLDGSLPNPSPFATDPRSGVSYRFETLVRRICPSQK